MKRFIVIFLCILCLFLTGCRTAMDASKKAAEHYQSPVQATIQVSAIAGIACDYQLKCEVDLETSTVEIIKPENLAGIKATIHSQSCRIEYEELALDSMMLPMKGMTPADCFDQTIYSLRNDIPVHYSYEKKNGEDCLCLTYEDEESGHKSTRIIWMQEKTLAMMEGEYYVDGILIMRMEVEELSFTETTAAE